MLASEFIELLQKAIEDYGDLELNFVSESQCQSNIGTPTIFAHRSRGRMWGTNPKNPVRIIIDVEGGNTPNDAISPSDVKKENEKL